MESTGSLDSMYLDETVRQINATTDTITEMEDAVAAAIVEPEVIEIDLGPSMEVGETQDEDMDFSEYLNLSPDQPSSDPKPTTTTALPTIYEPTDDEYAQFEDVYIGVPGFERSPKPQPPQQQQPMSLTFAPPPPPPVIIPGLSLLSDPTASATFIPPLPDLAPTPPPLSPLLLAGTNPGLQPTSLNPAFYSARSTPSPPASPLPLPAAV